MTYFYGGAMKVDFKKFVWLLVCCLMALSLVIASCGTKEETTPTTTITDDEEDKVVITETQEGYEIVTQEQEGYRDPDEPKYGGTLAFAWFEPGGFDPYYLFMVSCGTLYLVNEELLMGDWSKTPAGTGEAGIGGFLGYASRLTGQLCESWSMPDNETLLFNIRKGVYWQDKDPINGREYDAYDAAWAITRLWAAPMGAHNMIVAPGERIISATALDKWTLEVKVPPEAQGLQVIYTAAWLYQYPKEVVDTYGDMQDWHNVVGTGPYMLMDYVAGSSLTFNRNPNYWQHDPIHPENQLPYLDKLKWMIISDASTQLAAYRTGQLDISLGVALSHEDGVTLIKNHPEMSYVTLPGGDNHLYMRIDKPELPCSNLLVRQALTLAINKEQLIEDYYGGFADLLATPYPPDQAWAPFYTPLDEMPTEPFTPGSACSVQELFRWSDNSVTKAKQLLADAGYPDGFKMKINCAAPSETDFLSIIKQYFEAVNVELEIQQVEGSIMNGMRRGRTYEEGIYTASPTAAFPYDMHNTRIESFDCFSYYENPVTRAAYEEERKWVMKDDAKYAKALHDVVPFILEQCVALWCPNPRSYRMWWPWVQNYHGEFALGCDDEMLIYDYIWVDEEMKTGLGY
jgi:peptide/nickel transport system substrate-binding protein